MAAASTRPVVEPVTGGSPADRDPGKPTGMLETALAEAGSAAAQLAARHRSYAASSRQPAAFSQAAAITAAAQALGQARLLAEGRQAAGSACTETSAGGPADPPGPTDLREEAAQLLAGAQLLSRAVSELAARAERPGPDGSSLPDDRTDGIRACLQAAQRHLILVTAPAVPELRLPAGAPVPHFTGAALADENAGTASYTPLPGPEAVLADLPLQGRAAALVRDARAQVRSVLAGDDDRLLVIAGPCSVHDPMAAVEYAWRLAALQDILREELLIVMRVYLEKPRTVTGWPGLLTDPAMDGSCDVLRGLQQARQLLLDVASAGLPAACEWLDPVTPWYLADAVSWGAIGARTAGSQVHRRLASALPMPAGFKNAVHGGVQPAVDACRSAAEPHAFFGLTPRGTVAVIRSAGNPDCHVILRGGGTGPNYAAGQVSLALDMISGAGLPRRVMVDASHGNSGKDHRRQPAVAAAVAAQVAAGEHGIIGVMLESFLRAGRQEPGPAGTLEYGMSVTDACMDFGTTATVLRVLAEAARQRRFSVTPAAAQA
jgi:3-deoxy-7-phosphoheptulonate synthase